MYLTLIVIWIYFALYPIGDFVIPTFVKKFQCNVIVYVLTNQHWILQFNTFTGCKEILKNMNWHANFDFDRSTYNIRLQSFLQFMKEFKSVCFTNLACWKRPIITGKILKWNSLKSTCRKDHFLHEKNDHKRRHLTLQVFYLFFLDTVDYL